MMMWDVMHERIINIKDELKDLKATNLFTQEELDKFRNEQIVLEKNILEDKRNVNNFTRYITYKKCLLRSLNTRKSKIKLYDIKPDADHLVRRQITSLYEMAINLFPEDVKLLMSFFKFCKSSNNVQEACKTVSRMLAKYPEKPLIWQIGAKWYANDCSDIDTAMITLSKAVAIHKDNHMLHMEMVNVVLAAYGRTSDAEKRESYARLLERIMNTIFENMDDSGFYCDLLELLQSEHRFTFHLQKRVREYLVTNFGNNENVWHVLAQNERKDLPEIIDDLSIIDLTVADEKPSHGKNITKKRMKACIVKYQEGLAAISPENKPKLWSLYITFLLNLQKERGAGTALKTEALHAAFKQASDERVLDEKQYLAWLKWVDNKQAVIVAEKATNSIPNSVALWKNRLALQIIKDDMTRADQIFKLGIYALKENALPLWLSIIRYHLISSDANYVNLIYLDGLKQPEPISQELKPKYIKWLAMAKGIKAARHAYDVLAEQQPYCKELHNTMLELEAVDLEDLPHWNFVHRLNCAQFGQDVDVWIKHIKFYLRDNKEESGRVQELYRLALDSLSKDNLLLFEASYGIIIREFPQ